jgi:hypothetical protein
MASWRGKINRALAIAGVIFRVWPHLRQVKAAVTKAKQGARIRTDQNQANQTNLAP